MNRRLSAFRWGGYGVLVSCRVARACFDKLAWGTDTVVRMSEPGGFALLSCFFFLLIFIFTAVSLFFFPFAR